MVFVSPSSTLQTTTLLSDKQVFHQQHYQSSWSQNNENLQPTTPLQIPYQASPDHEDVKLSPTASAVSLSHKPTLPDNAGVKDIKTETTLVYKRRRSNIVLDGSQGEVFSLSFLKKRNSLPTSAEKLLSGPEVCEKQKLVRKKSGELVKSSLKLNSLIDAKSKSMPATPSGYNKSVHFGQNVDVRYFNERDRPTAVSANTSPLLRPSHGGSSKASFDLHGFKRKHHHNNNFGADDDDDYDSLDEDFELSVDSESEDDPEDYEVSWDFKPINFGKIKYSDQFNKKAKLFLEKLLIEDENSSQLVGYVAVKNMSYEKKIHVRYTLDDWKTIIEIEAFFNNDSIPRVLKRSDYDRFKFSIDLNNLGYLIQNKADIRFQFAIRFNYDQEEIWDNNMFKNYEILLSKNTFKTFHRPNATLTINDYFDESMTPDSFKSNTFASNRIGFDEINDYFNNYQLTLKSPETPFSLKVGGGPKDNDDVSQLNFSNVTFDSYRKTSPTTTTTSVSTRSNNYTTKKSLSTFSFSSHPHDPQEKNKPSINSKSYQELLETYCFYKSPDNSPVNSSGTNLVSSASETRFSNSPTTISSFLTNSINN